MPVDHFPLIHGVRNWSDTEEDLRKRLEAHLVRLRQARMVELLSMGEADPHEEQLMLPLGDPWFGHEVQPAERPALEISVELSWNDRRRITTRVRRLLAARASASKLSHLKEADRKLLELRLPGVRLGGPPTQHAADELAAALMDEMPWLRKPILHIWHGTRRSVQDGLGLGFAPLLLDGPPGCGKSHLARRVAELAGVPLVTIDLGSGTEGFRVAGLSKGWSNSMPGRPLEEILASGLGNPLVSIDELDKGGSVTSAGGTQTSAWHSLLGLLEPGSARRWECPHFRVTFDLSRVNWILTANTVRHIPAPLLSRCKILQVREPSPADLAGVAFREGARRGVDQYSLELLARAILRARGSLTLRHVMRALDELRVTEAQGRLH